MDFPASHVWQAVHQGPELHGRCSMEFLGLTQEHKPRIFSPHNLQLNILMGATLLHPEAGVRFLQKPHFLPVKSSLIHISICNLYIHIYMYIYICICIYIYICGPFQALDNVYELNDNLCWPHSCLFESLPSSLWVGWGIQRNPRPIRTEVRTKEAHISGKSFARQQSMLGGVGRVLIHDWIRLWGKFSESKR